MNKSFQEKIREKIKRYQTAVETVEFARLEQSELKKLSESEEDLLRAVDVIIESSKELNRILENCPDSMFVADGEGVCLRANRAFENMVDMNRDEVLNRNVSDLDAEGVLRPSVCRLALKEKRKISVLQDVKNVRGLAVTGVPVFDENDKLFRVITNAVSVNYVKSLTTYVENQANGEECSGILRKHIIAKSDEMKAILKLADMIKNTESSVLILGETGVGKGLLTEYIHETGNREGKLVQINCGAIPDALLESELFGYESGAFTGADRRGKQGLIEISRGGTLFLDEVSELPLLLQVKILHFLQSKSIIRVGGTKEIKVDTRIIAASNKPLEAEVEKGTFRSDLYYRLNVIPINIPPLRERQEDIVPMAEYFLSVYMGKYNKQMTLSPEVMELILANEWKGNIRELENYIERIVVTNESNVLLPVGAAADQAVGGNPKPLRRAKDDTEREVILKAYEKYGSSYKVAEALGISQATAYRKIKKYK